MANTSDYPVVYCDPHVYAQWEERFGAELKHLMQAILTRSIRASDYTPISIKFKGNLAFMPNQAKLRITAPTYDNEERETLLNRLLGKKALGRRITYVIYFQKEEVA